MKNKSILSSIPVLIGLAAATTGAFFFLRLFPDFGRGLTAGQPPLSPLNLPSQTVNGITAQLESYYGDATRIIFVVRVSGDGESYFLENVSLKEANGGEINAGYGLNSLYGDPSAFLIDFVTAQPLQEERLDGWFGFTVITPGESLPLASFQFDIDLSVHPELILNPKQAVWANGIEILLDRLVITPAYTQAYLCYIRPTAADWGIGSDTTLRVDSQVASVQTYSLLFDPGLGDGSKGGEPGWTPPVQDGRCIKIGFPVGAARPKSLTLTIPALEQSMPEVIPAEDLAVAYERLKTEGIDMEWHTVDHGAYPEYKKFPAGMSQDEVFRQFMRALGYIHPGGWVFDLPLIPQEGTPAKFSTSSYGAAAPLPFPNKVPPAVATLDGRIRAFDLSPNLKAIAFATSQGVVVYEFDRKNVRVLNDSENFFSVDWSPDGRKLAAGGLVMQNAEFGKAHLVVWDISNWQVIFEPEYEDYMTDTLYGNVTWSPDSRSLAVGNGYMGVTTYDIQTGQVVSEQDIFAGSVADISWSPDGSRLIATGDMGYGIRRWKVSTDESVRLFDQRASTSMSVEWSPDGRRIASGHSGGTVCLWTASTNECDGLVYAHQTATFSLAWSPDGKHLATGGGVIHLWDAQTGSQVTAFGLDDRSVYTKLAWPKAEMFISLQTGYGEEAPTIVRFWDVTTGQVLMEFHGGMGQLWQ